MNRYVPRRKIRKSDQAMVPLTGNIGAGRHLIIDAMDWPVVSEHLWHAHKAERSCTLYARTAINGRSVLLHRLIMGAEKGQIIDHIDGDGLNNTRDNLRFVTQAENARAAAARRPVQRLFDEWESRL